MTPLDFNPIVWIRKNFYTVLGVSPSSDPKEIKDSFYRLSKEFHPDLNKEHAFPALKEEFM